MNVALVVTGLYPDQETLRAAVGLLDETASELHWLELNAPEDDTQHWDAVLDTLLKADRVISI